MNFTISLHIVCSSYISASIITLPIPPLIRLAFCGTSIVTGIVVPTAFFYIAFCLTNSIPLLAFKATRSTITTCIIIQITISVITLRFTCCIILHSVSTTGGSVAICTIVLAAILPSTQFASGFIINH